MSDLLQYFGLDYGYELRWTRGTNTRYLMRRAIEDPSVHMIEVDVTLAQDGVTPICSRPPDFTSDFTLVDMLDTCWGILGNKKTHRKGLKLNLLNRNTVIIASTLLQYYLCPTATTSEQSHATTNTCWPPLILYADVLRGPDLSEKILQELVDWHELLAASNRLPVAIIGLGWTTTPADAVPKKRPQGNSDASKKTPVYNDEMIQEMKEISKNFNSSLLFNFRVSYVLNHKDAFSWWETFVLQHLAGELPVSLDNDGDVIRQDAKAEKLQSTTGEASNEEKPPSQELSFKQHQGNVVFLLTSSGRDEIGSDDLQQFVLQQITKSSNNGTVSKNCLLLNLHQNHSSMLDGWELVTAEGIGKETMPSLIKEYIAEKYPNNKRFRYT